MLKDVGTEAPSLLMGSSRQMTTVRELARRAGVSDAKALITGESGVGKDLVAREIHARSRRAQPAHPRQLRRPG